ncbi:UDP-glucose 4-epimerase [Rhodovulum sp. ES.010]|uniref:NAD-dependent epimerase/dehydratase family protein n=1 Tax=Rhodovulum sp. ES.010 TaxID=1882821 RepID=UPI000926EA18|nr:NAD-dependent epimerase/dehydratase family protein [Rhodovulum sp. ES.010]SIO03340.1 UDP-glucose 4-epimerase [Rhodovulum sp. ES.010]
MGRAAVLGGAGFLGSHVADALQAAGHGVRVFDRAPSKWLAEGQEMIVGDITDPAALAEAIDGCDYVYNFAAVADLDKALDRPLDTIRVNILGNALAMEAARAAGAKRFVFASSIYVYSQTGGFYRCSKQSAETYVEEYQRAYGLDYTILRYGSLYGPRSDDSNGLFRIVRNALRDGMVTYTGSPDALREYIHVEDAAKASVAALGEEFRNDSLVLTGQQLLPIREVLHMISEILGYETEVLFEERTGTGHYVRTPYAYMPKPGRKYVSPLHVDLGQGLLQLIDEVRNGTED